MNVFGGAGFAPNLVAAISSIKSIRLSKLTNRIWIWSEDPVHLGNACFESFLLFAVLLNHINTRLHLIIVLLVFTHADLVAHPWSKSFLEVGERDVTFLFRIKHRVHKRDDLALSRLNFVFNQVRFEVLIRDITIVVDVHLLKHTEETWLAIENFILNLN